VALVKPLSSSRFTAEGTPSSYGGSSVLKSPKGCAVDTG